jgi:hypothetical protein
VAESVSVSERVIVKASGWGCACGLQREGQGPRLVEGSVVGSANVRVSVTVNHSSVVGAGWIGAGVERPGMVSISSHERGHRFEEEESENESESANHQSCCSSSIVCAVDLVEERRLVVVEGCEMQSMKGIFSARRPPFLVEVETLTARGMYSQLCLSSCAAVAMVSASVRPCDYSCVLFLALCRGQPDFATGWI